MVMYTSTRLDSVFGALADPTRRAVLAKLRGGGLSVSELATDFEMSLPGFAKHLGILESAGLIHRNKTGRVVNCTLNAGAMKGALEWLARYEAFWNMRLDNLGAYLQQQGKSVKSQPNKRNRNGKSVRAR